MNLKNIFIMQANKFNDHKQDLTERDFLYRTVCITGYVLTPLIVIGYLWDALFAVLLANGMPVYWAPLFFIGQCFFRAGLLATAVDMSLARFPRLSLKDFFVNAKKYWLLYAVLLILTLVSFVLLKALNPFILGFEFLVFKTHLMFFIILIFSLIYFWFKYPRQLRILTSRAFSLSFFLPILVFYGFYLICFYLSFFIQTPLVEPERILFFVFRYLEIVFLVYCFLHLRNALNKNEELTKKRELFLVDPSYGIINDIVWSFILPQRTPIFSVLKAFTPKDYNVEEFNRYPFFSWDFMSGKLVAITSFTFNSHTAFYLAKRFKEAGSTVIMGGAHVMHLPDEALDFCDAVVIGPAEGVWREIINDYETGTLKKTYHGHNSEELMAEVNNYLLEEGPEITGSILETTRGCKFNCEFCTIPIMNNRTILKNDINTIVTLAKKVMTKRKILSFIDNNIYCDPEYARELFKQLEPLKIKWTASSSLDIAQNEQTLKSAYASGCRLLLFGYEIFADSPEQQKGGKFSLAKRYLEFSRKVKKARIAIKAHFIFGFDSDRFSNLWRLFKFCFCLMPTTTTISFLTPFPGTKLFHRLNEEGRLVDLNWRNYNNKFVFSHPKWDSKIMTHLYYPVMLMFFGLTSTGGYLVLLFIFFSYLFFGNTLF
jgi:radical SAM superfamily enzyme YgiQ (UPF0313 family)